MMDELKHTTESVLTRRELEILALIAEGLCSKQIAARLIISENTVANHRKNMLHKTGAQSSYELIHLNNKYSEIKNSHL